MVSTENDANCPHRNKANLVNNAEVRKKLKNCKKPFCAYCASPSDSMSRLWVCMACGKFACDQEGHIEKHCTNTEISGPVHSLAFNLDSHDVWCHSCNLKLETNEWLGKTDILKKFLDDIRSFRMRSAKGKPADIPKKIVEEKPKVEEKPTKMDKEVRVNEKKVKSKVKNTGDVFVKGLPNLGNTCFFNSVLQCLMHTPQLLYFTENIGQDEKIVTKECIQIVHEKKIEIPEAEIFLPSVKFLLTKCLNNLLAEFRSGQDPNPRPLFQQISHTVPRFRGYSQQDSHEFLRYLLDGLRKEEQDRWKQGIASHLGLTVDTNPKKAYPEKVLLAKGFLEATGRPLIDAIFGGSLIQSIRCSRCNHVSNRLEPYLDLSLPLSFSSAKSHLSNNQKKSGVPTKHQQKKIRKQQKKQSRGGRRRTSTGKSSELSDVPGGDEIVDNEIVDETKNTNESLEKEDVFEEDDDEIDVLSDGITRLNGTEPLVDYTQLLNASKMTETDDENTLYRCLQDFISEEFLTGANAYECEVCCTDKKVRIYRDSESWTDFMALMCCKKQKNSSEVKLKVDAYKRYVIFSPPTVLTIHFKRFEQTHHGLRSSLRKVRGHVQFPLKLDLASFCSRHNPRISPNQKHIWYSLYGIVSHSGELNNGHYVAYVRRRPTMPHHRAFIELSRQPDRLNSINMLPFSSMDISDVCENAEAYFSTIEDGSQWYYVSDASYSPVQESRVLGTEAYILFYERVM